jgi:outer membrane protein TolC
MLVTAGLLAINGQAQSPAPKPISLQECINMAMQLNLQLRIERYNPKLALDSVMVADSIYDPNYTMTFGRAYNESPPQLFPQAAGLISPRSEIYNDQLTMALNGMGPMGLQYRIPVSIYKRSGNRYYDYINNEFYGEYNASAALELTQPLLKNFKIDRSRWNLETTKRRLKMSEYELRYQTLIIIGDVQLAYYDLITAREMVKVNEKAVELSERLLADNKAKVRAGTLPPLDEKQAEAEVAMNKANLIGAKQDLLIKENALKSLIVDKLQDWQNLTLIPSEQLLAVPESFDIGTSWKNGLASRPDLLKLRADLERYNYDLKYYKNQTLPDLSLLGTYGQSGIKSSPENVPEGILSPRNINYFAGFRFTIPVFNQAAKSNYRLSRDARFQSELFVQAKEQQIMATINDAISRARSSFDKVSATRQAREYAEMALDAEQKKLENGKSTSFFVLQFQRDLTNRRSDEINALAAYNKALASFSQAEGTTLEKLKINVEVK